MEACYRSYIAEFFGTMFLVIMGCGVFVVTGWATVPTALAFGLAIIAMSYAIGNISGAHLNPAVTVAHFINGRMYGNVAVMYIVFQILGAIVGAGILYGIFLGCDWYDIAVDGIGCNYFGRDVIDMPSAILLEVVLTMIFVITVLGTYYDKRVRGREGLINGAAFALMYLLGLSLTGASLNPARSIGPALISCVSDVRALSEVWLFIFAPIAGAVIASLLYKFLFYPKLMVVEKVEDTCESIAENVADNE